jgi:hypothetical protein
MARLGDRSLLSWFFAMATLAFAAAAWRWGMRVCAALAGLSFFLLLTQGPVPRLLRYYVHFAPLWAVLTLGGGVAIAAALALRRFLASGIGGERGGLTAEPLFEDPAKHRSLEVAAALAAGPAAKVTASDDRSLAPGGGRFGGGGASGEY